jgi:hypothetical protein
MKNDNDRNLSLSVLRGAENASPIIGEGRSNGAAGAKGAGVKRILVLACCLVASIGAVACTSFKSRHYAGEKIALTKEDISAETVWKIGDDVYFVRLQEGGTLAAATIKWEEKKGAYAMRTYQLVPSQIGDDHFLNVKEGEYYTILRLVGAGTDAVVLFTVDKDKLEKDMADGLLQASQEDGNIVMDGPKEALDRYIASHIDTLFSLEAAGVARLISGALK